MEQYRRGLGINAVSAEESSPLFIFWSSNDISL
jgi:hypothetical protein